MRSDPRLGWRSDIALVIGTPASRSPNAVGIAASQSAEVLEIAFVNNMPDPAFAETERQFLRLLTAASGDLSIAVHRYSIPGPERGPAVRRRIRSSYGSLDDLLTTSPAGCIVTGTEPRTVDLTDERSWDGLVVLFRWAADGGVGLWLSCLAAHAALLAHDGITRVRLPRKYSGVFRHEVVSSHPLAHGIEAGSGPGSVVMVPHSRLNTVPDHVLRSGGYDILLTSPEVGWTLAAKQVAASTFVLVQGHPEYSATSLLREYRRDVRRYLRGDRSDYPDVPSCYLDERGAAVAARFRAIVTAAGGGAPPPTDPTGAAGSAPPFPYTPMARRIVNTWQAAGVQLLANWLAELSRDREVTGA